MKHEDKNTVQHGQELTSRPSRSCKKAIRNTITPSSLATGGITNAKANDEEQAGRRHVVYSYKRKIWKYLVLSIIYQIFFNLYSKNQSSQVHHCQFMKHLTNRIGVKNTVHKCHSVKR